MRCLVTLLFCWQLLSAQPRIVSTTPSITEILFALGLGDRVVAVSTYCRFPAKAQQLPKIGSFLDPNIETILRQKPTLVIVQKNPKRLTERLRAVHLNVLEVNPGESMAGVHDAIDAIGKAVDHEEEAVSLNRMLRDGLAEYRRHSTRNPKPRVLFIVGRTSGSLDGLIAAAKGSYLTQLLDAAGANNVLSGAVGAYPKISYEEVMRQNPDVIIDMGDSTHTGSITETQRRSTIELWGKFRTVNAVRNGRVFPVADDRFVVPGPRMLEAVLALGNMLR